LQHCLGGLMETKRLFLAINFPFQFKRQLAEMQKGLKPGIGNIKWVEEENFHITLKFLGEVPVNALGEIVDAIKKGIGSTDPFYITLNRLGVFPNPHKVKVIWLGVEEGNKPLCNLFKNIDTQLEGLGFNKEHGYKPHLTLGRCRLPHFIDISRYNHGFTGRCKVAKVDLMKSELTPKGPIYEIVASIPLDKGLSKAIS
jgi:RNA 2',3'-cyclic 3'-phosphodiesterase